MRMLMLLSILAGSAISCTQPKQKAEGIVLSPQKMEQVLWDIFQADAFTQSYILKDSSKNPAIENAELQKKIFELHKIRKEDYTVSYDYYTARPAEMRVILDSISTKAERDRNAVMQERYSGIKPVAY